MADEIPIGRIMPRLVTKNLGVPLQELTDLSLEAQSFPKGQRLCVIMDVVNPVKTWMLMESLLRSEQAVLVAGCKVRQIRIVEPEPKPTTKTKGVRSSETWEDWWWDDYEGAVRQELRTID